MPIATRMMSPTRMLLENPLPEGMVEPRWYEPVERGLESKIAERMAFLRGLDDQANQS